MYLFVNAVKKTLSGVVVTAANGGPDGPPVLTWILDTQDNVEDYYIGKRVKVTVEEAP